MRATSLSGGKERKGVILLVVLAMITLLTILGITFVLYSDASEATARISMEGEKTSFQLNPADFSAGELMQMAFGQLVFDVEDDDAGQRSGLRGHSLARDMYGYRYAGEPFSMGSPPPATFGMGLNDRPFRGTGRLEADKPFINFTTFYQNQSGSLVPEILRDPERLGTRIVPTLPNAYAGGFNPPYTYADLNHVFLAKLGPDGQVDEPSFVRREAMGTLGQPAPLGAFNGTSWVFTGAWETPTGKYNFVRPRHFEHPLFPKPSDGWGDVRNLPWGTHNDAVWVDLGYDPKTAPNGRKYKPMFAFTILDLDGRVNVNAHGNMHSRDGAGAINGGHASRDGAGPWEVSLARALAQAPGDTTWRNLFLGANGLAGRHKPDATLSGIYATQNLVALNPQHTHGPLDGNAGQENALPMGISPQPLALPGAPMGAFLSPFGRFVAEVYGGMGPNEVTPFHESMFHPFFDLSSTTPGNKLFGHSHLGLLMGRSVRSPFAWQNSELNRLVFGQANDPFAPFSTRDPRYDRLTTLSWDLDRPGMVPYLTDRTSQGVQMAPLTAWNPILPSAGYPVFQPQVNFPAAGQQPFPPLPAAAPQGTPLTPPNPGSEFDPFLQSQLALAKRLNLRRYLTTFPPLDPATGLYADMTVAGQAVLDRQQFAQDIFQHLVMATGAMRPTDAGFPTMPGAATDPRYHATKWLAQLAANLVDYIDKDDVMTVFPWNNGQITDLVVGVELSRLALNELYVQVENDPSEAGPGAKKATKEFRAKIYAELVNPLLSNVTPTNPGPDDDHGAVLRVGTQNVHVLEVVKPSAIPALRDISQKSGLIGNDHASIPGALIGQVTWDFPAKVMPAGENFGALSPAGDGHGLSNGFVVVGPQPDNQASDLTNSRWTTGATGPDGDIIHKDMGFLIPKDTQKLDTLMQQDIPYVLLRRLAVPGMPLQENAAQPNYNPYVTIDMVQVTPKMLADNDARKIIDDPNKGANQVNTNPDKVDIASRKSYGRSQPYFGIPASAFAATPAMQTYGTLIPQDPANPVAGVPKCTFWRHNTRMDTPPAAFMPAVAYPFTPGNETFETPRFRPHLDRWPSSIGEILAVPTCRAHEVVLLNNHRAEFCAGWNEPTSRLYRFLELAQAGSVRNLQGVSGPIAVGAEGGRVPGKINVNTMTYEVFKALCDAQPTTNRFTDAQVDQAWQYLQANRPYWGFGVGEAAVGDQLNTVTPRGMFQSIMRRHPGMAAMLPPPYTPTDAASADPTDLLNLMLDPQNASNNGGTPPPVVGTSRFGMGGANELAPSVRHELLSKILGNTTSRSNCFAVWVTVGYFEVVSEQGNPSTAAPKYILGQEMQPRTRRRMFALIDRTQLEAWRVPLQAGVAAIPANLADPMSGQLTSPVALQLTSLTYQGSGGPTTLAAGVMNSATGKLYPVTLGSVLTFDPGTIYEETTEVVDMGMGTLGVVLRRPHGVGGPVVVSSRGNPGPVPRENIDLDDLKGSGLIPYFQVLE